MRFLIFAGIIMGKFKLKRFKDLSIFKQILSVGFAAILSISIFFYFGILPNITETIYENKKKALLNVLDASYSVVENLNNRVEVGELTIEEAKAEAVKLVSTIRFNEKDYLYVNDLDGYCRVSNNPDNIGQNFSNSQDAYGVYTNKEMASILRSQGYGYKIFHWEKPEGIIGKLYCFKLFKPWGWMMVNGRLISDIESEVVEIRNTFLIYLLVIVALLLAVVTFVAKVITKPVKKLSDLVITASDGNYEVTSNVESQNEIGLLSSSFNKLIENIRNAVNELNIQNKVAKEALESAEQTKAKVVESQKYMSEHAGIIKNYMQQFEQGDLTIELSKENDDEIGEIYESFNSVVLTLRSVIEQINELVESSTTASTQISSAVEQMAAGAEEQSAQTGDVTKSADEIAQTIYNSTEKAISATEQAKQAGKAAKKGGSIVNTTIQKMNHINIVVKDSAATVTDLGESSKKIGEIVSVINDIADQTNLLALNAAIEAARAGEQGRGFAVVADEVRKLSERTSKATKEIEAMISQVIIKTNVAVEAMKKGTSEVDEGLNLVNEAGTSLSEIISSTELVVDNISQIAIASEQQSGSIEQISQNISAVNKVAHETALGLQNVAKATEELQSLSESTNSIVEKFKLNENDKKLLN